MGNEEMRDYVAYLLRLWQAGGEDGTAWRASLESAGTGERVGFASLEELFRFLDAEVRRTTHDQTRWAHGVDWGGGIDG
ncbi:MAG: hypothetical protein PVF54_05175 [Anaerolineae bacterium]|jgi:hypothetical protein